MEHENHTGNFDVAVIGAGPVGCVTAIAHAKKGCRVVLLEANPNSANRLAGEWLHPPALSILKSLQIPLPDDIGDYPNGRGFAVFPGDGTDSVILPYADTAPGLSIDHRRLVECLRNAVTAENLVTYIPYARVKKIDDHNIHYLHGDSRIETIVSAERIIGSDGKNSVVRAAIGLESPGITVSHIAAVRILDANLPIEGYGHVFLGGPGPLLAYRIDQETIRLIMDLPGELQNHGERVAYLWEAFSSLLPGKLQESFSSALMTGDVIHAVNRISPRRIYGSGHMFIAGDAVGYYHPLTAVGMTLGFQDAVCMADAKDFESYKRARRRDCFVPELLSAGLYDVFAGGSYDTTLVCNAIFRTWRSGQHECFRSMQFLACADTRISRFSFSFVKTLFYALLNLLRDGVRVSHWKHSLLIGKRILERSFSLLRGDVIGFMQSRAGLSVINPDVTVKNKPEPAPAAMSSIENSMSWLINARSDDGSWEGEMVWCPMLVAQYVITWHMLKIDIEETQRELILHHIEKSRLHEGLWGLHEHGEPSLYVTTLVYIAARILGTESNHPMLVPARQFIHQEDVTAIPTWGKFWLSMLGLYDWGGLAPVPPELWRLPNSFPLHPSKLYCHTRLIYLAMSVIYASRFVSSSNNLTAELRSELFTKQYEEINWSRKINLLRTSDLYRPAGLLLRFTRLLLRVVERLHNPKIRLQLLPELRDRIRWELQTTNYTCISPVSGLLNIIALKINDPDDPDAKQAIKNFSGWIWQDQDDGLRVTGARSISWDTAFALQALAIAETDHDCQVAIESGVQFLVNQQIQDSFPGYAENDRNDPQGGWCFAGHWHGWPVSDCTAEAIIAIVSAGYGYRYRETINKGVQFILRCQNNDGGFGSYEARRCKINLEPLNPAEMFANSMTEQSYVECTSSCITALQDAKSCCNAEQIAKIDNAIRRAVDCLTGLQRQDGSFEGAWGVYFIYGTMFGIRGLLTGGLPPSHPAIRKACGWLRSKQNPDGSFGESHESALQQKYVPLAEGQGIQTAWALIALLEAREPDWQSIQSAARFLLQKQMPDGNWPREHMVGIFFHTALLHYDLYRSYFPLLALALYEARRMEHEVFTGSKAIINVSSQPRVKAG